MTKDELIEKLAESLYDEREGELSPPWVSSGGDCRDRYRREARMHWTVITEGVAEWMAHRDLAENRAERVYAWREEME